MGTTFEAGNLVLHSRSVRQIAGAIEAGFTKITSITIHATSSHLNEFVLFEGGVNFGPVKADNYGAVDVEYRNPGLAGFFHRRLGVIAVYINIFVGVLNLFVVQIAHGFVAKRAPLRAINNQF